MNGNVETDDKPARYWLAQEQKILQYDLRRYPRAPCTLRGALQVASLALISSFFLSALGLAVSTLHQTERFYDLYGREYWCCDFYG